MRYFDRLLSEALDDEDPSIVGPKPKKRRVWQEKEANDVLNALVKDPDNLALQNRLRRMQKADPKAFAKWQEKNSTNPDYKKALKHVSERDKDPLLLWMLKTLEDRAQKGAGT